MKLVDCHSHTVHYSTDAAQTVDELLQDAKAHDLAGICLTDLLRLRMSTTPELNIFLICRTISPTWTGSELPFYRRTHRSTPGLN